MHEDTFTMNDEEMSDSEVMISNPHIPQFSENQGGRRMRNEATMIDTQLKALGLYEEGLSFEQKEELLAVVAASKQTAEQEESMRIRAIEWQQKLFPSEVDLVVETTNEIPSPVPSESHDSPKVEASMELLNLNQNASSSGISEITGKNATSPIKSPAILSPVTPSVEHKINVVQCDSHKKPTRRGRGQQPASQAHIGQLTIHHPPADNQEQEEIIEDDESIVKIDATKQKKELERFIPEWKPCLSPDRDELNSERLAAVYLNLHQNQEDINCSQNLLDAIEEFHNALETHQQHSNMYISWGQPVTVGRAYATRSSRNRTADSENSDGLYSFQSSETTTADDTSDSKNSMCESYLRLREFSKVMDQNPSVPNSGGNTNTVPLKRSSRTANKALLQRMRASQSSRIKAKSAARILSDNKSLNRDKLEARREKIFGPRLANCRKTVSRVTKPLPPSDDENSNISVGTEDSSFVANSFVAAKGKAIGTSKASELKQNCSSQSVDNDGKLSRNAKNYVEKPEQGTSKRRKCPTSIKNLSSPSKRLKETGAV